MEEHDLIQRLQQMESVSASPSLLPDVMARLGLVNADISDHTPIEDLEQALRDDSWQVRLSAVRRLRLLKDPEVDELLKFASNDKNEFVRLTATQALKNRLSAPIRVLVVADHQLLRQGIRLMLNGEDNFEVVGEAENEQAALSLAMDLKPDIVLVDISLETSLGLKAAKQLLRSFPKTRIVLFAGPNEEKLLLEARRIGVHGYLPKTLSLEDLLRALHAVYQGARVLSGPQPLKSAHPTPASPSHVFKRYWHRAALALAAVLAILLLVGPILLGFNHAAAIGTPHLTYRGHTAPVEAVAWSHDGKLIASAGGDWTVQVWNATTGQRLLTYKGHSGPVSDVAWSPDDKYIASASTDRTVQIWNAATGQRLLTYKGHTEVVNGIAWSPNGKLIASASTDQTVQVWNAATGQRLLTYKGHTDAVSAVAWSPDGKDIASASIDRSVQVWNAATGRLIGQAYYGHTDAVSAVAWSPDGKDIASAGADQTVRVWDTATGQLIFTYKGHTLPVNAVAWSPDGKYIASAGADQTVQVWAG